MSYQVSKRRSCEVIQLHRSVYYYKSVRHSDEGLRLRIIEIAKTRIRYGYRRIHILLIREGWRVNHKKVRRIYIEEGLNVRRRKPRRRVASQKREEIPSFSSIDMCWSMDFVTDEQFNGRRIRALTIVDNYSRECLEIYVVNAFKVQMSLWF